MILTKCTALYISNFGHNFSRWNSWPERKKLQCNGRFVQYINCVWIINTKTHTHRHDRELFHQTTLMHNFLYSLTIRLLHYYPRHVSSINMPIFRRKNCIHTASGIFALCKRLNSTLCTVQTFTESEDTRCCANTIFPPEDEHVSARNMSRIIV